MLLPHGYEGQGPEHSSARLERFLQLCAEDNMQVCYPSTPAQYFHVLRRQMKRNFRKPLIVMTPKSLLRHKACVLAGWTNWSQGGSTRCSTTPAVDAGRVRRVLLCSGKVYYDLLERRTQAEANDVAIVRVEQFYPFPEELLTRALKRYRKAQECRLGAGRIAEHGRLVVHGAATARTGLHRRLRRPRRQRQPGDRFVAGPPARAEGTGRGGDRGTAPIWSCCRRLQGRARSELVLWQ